MSENTNEPAGDRQDPAESNQLDTAVETTDQPATPEEVSDSEEPASPAPTSVTVAPTQPENDKPVEVKPANPSVKSIGGRDYKVTPDGGHRLQS